MSTYQFSEEELDAARHLPDEEPNIVDLDDPDVEVLDGPDEGAVK